MSIECMTRVWKNSKSDGRALLLLLAIADWARDDGTGAYPGVKKLAEKTRMSERNVRYMIVELQALGELKVGGRSSRYGTNEYAVLTREANFAAPPVDPERQTIASLERQTIA